MRLGRGTTDATAAFWQWPAVVGRVFSASSPAGCFVSSARLLDLVRRASRRRRRRKEERVDPHETKNAKDLAAAQLPTPRYKMGGAARIRWGTPHAPPFSGGDSRVVGHLSRGSCPDRFLTGGRVAPCLFGGESGTAAGRGTRPGVSGDLGHGLEAGVERVPRALRRAPRPLLRHRWVQAGR